MSDLSIRITIPTNVVKPIYGFRAFFQPPLSVSCPPGPRAQTENTLDWSTACHQERICFAPIAAFSSIFEWDDITHE
jgi:hypothetical protein